MMQLCGNTRFILRLYRTCRSSVLYVTTNENYLVDRDENATIDADSTISTVIADRSHSDRMCDLGISLVGNPIFHALKLTEPDGIHSWPFTHKASIISHNHRGGTVPK